MNTDVCIVCEVQQLWTYREQNVACLMLTNYSYHIRKILLLVFLLNASTAAQQHIGTAVRISKEKWSRLLREFGLNLISGSVWALVSIFLSTQIFENEIWQAKKWRQFLQTLCFLNRASWNTYVKRKKKMRTFSIIILLNVILYGMYWRSNFFFTRKSVQTTLISVITHV
jgi:hypothetical protein